MVNSELEMLKQEIDALREQIYAYMEYPEIKTEIERIESILDGNGRVLIRPSGTEPLVRVMLEGKDEGQIRELAQGLADLIKEKLA